MATPHEAAAELRQREMAEEAMEAKDAAGGVDDSGLQHRSSLSFSVPPMELHSEQRPAHLPGPSQHQPPQEAEGRQTRASTCASQLGSVNDRARSSSTAPRVLLPPLRPSTSVSHTAPLPSLAPFTPPPVDQRRLSSKALPAPPSFTVTASSATSSGAASEAGKRSSVSSTLSASAAAAAPSGSPSASASEPSCSTGSTPDSSPSSSALRLQQQQSTGARQPSSHLTAVAAPSAAVAAPLPAVAAFPPSPAAAASSLFPPPAAHTRPSSRRPTATSAPPPRRPSLQDEEEDASAVSSSSAQALHPVLLRFRREDVESFYTSFSSSKNDSEAWRLAALCLLLYTLPFIVEQAAFKPFDLRFLILRAAAALPILLLLLLRHRSSLLSSPSASQLALTVAALVFFTVEHVDGFSSGDNQGLLDTGAAILFFCVLPALHLRVPATILVCCCSMLLRLLLTGALAAGLYGARWCELGGAQCQQFTTPWLEVLGHESIIVLVGVSSGLYCWHCERLERREFWYRNLLAETVDNNQQLLQRMLPASVCSKLQKGDTIIAEKHDHVSLLFVDLTGFSSLVALTSPVLVVHVLDKMFNMLDALSEQYGVYKVETVFDTWVGACGLQEEEGEEVEGMSREERERWRLTRRDSDDEIRMKRCVNATKIAQLALAMVRLSPKLEEEIKADIAGWESDAQPSVVSPAAEEDLLTPSSPSVLSSPAPLPLSLLPTLCLQLRVGIHSGSVMAGVIGRKLPRYRLFGDTVNTTARMCTNGTAGRVHVSPDIAAIFKDSVVLPAVACRDHALRSIKGKGSITTCYLQPDDAVLSETVRPKQPEQQQTANAAAPEQERKGGRQARQQHSAAIAPGRSRTVRVMPTTAESSGSSSSAATPPRLSRFSPPMHVRTFISPAASLLHPPAAVGPLDASASSGIHRLLSLTNGAGLGGGGAAAAGGGKDAKAAAAAALFARGSASIGLHHLSFADLVHRNTMLQREEATDDGEGEATDSSLGDDRKGGSASDGSPALSSTNRRLRAQRGSRGSRSSRLHSGRIGGGPHHHRRSSRARDSSSITRSRAQTEAERMQAAYPPITAIRSARVGPRGRSVLLKKKLPSAALRPAAAGSGGAAAAVIPEDGSGGEGEGEDDRPDDDLRNREKRRRRMTAERRRKEDGRTVAAAASAADTAALAPALRPGSMSAAADGVPPGGKAAEAETKEMADAAAPLTIVTSSPPTALPLRLRPSHHRARTLGHQQMQLLLPRSDGRRAAATSQPQRTDSKKRRMKKSGSMGAGTGEGLAGELLRRGGSEAAAGLLSSDEGKEEEDRLPLPASSQHLPLPGTLNDSAVPSASPSSPHWPTQSLSVSASSLSLQQPGSPSLERRASIHSRSSRVAHAMAELNREKEEKGVAAAAGDAAQPETAVTVAAFSSQTPRSPLRDRKSMPDLSTACLLSAAPAPPLVPSSDMDGLPFHLLDPDTIRLGLDLSFADYPDLERKYQHSQSRRVFRWLTTRLSLLLLAYLLLSVMDLITRMTGIADPAQPTLQGRTAVSRFIARVSAGLLPGLLLVWLMANTRRPRVLCLERPLARLFPVLSRCVLLLLCVLAANLLFSDVSLPYPGVDTWCAIIVLCGLASSQFRLPFVHSVALTVWCTACYLLAFVLLPLAFPFTTVDSSDLSLSVVVQCLLFCLCMLCLFTVISRMQEVRARERFLTLLAIKKQRVDTSALLERLLPKNVIGQLLQMGRAVRGEDGAVSGQAAADDGSALGRGERASTDLSQHSLERRFSNAPHERQKQPLHSGTESSLVALPSPQPSLASTSSLLASMYPSVTVMQADVCSFTPLCARSTPQQVITMLNSLFLLFDSLTDQHRVYKVETIGDAVLAVCGAPTPDVHHAFRMCELAIAARDALRAFTPSHDSREAVRMRFGLHTGRVVGGVVGMRKMPRFHIYGQTVSGAGSMEQQAEPMTICISAETWKSCRLHDRWGSETLHVRRILEPADTAGDLKRRQDGQRAATMSGESEADESSLRSEEEDSWSEDDSEQPQQGHMRRYELVGHRKPAAERTISS